jgi:arylsulfatase A-like enzyme
MYGMMHYLLTVPQNQNFLILKWFFDPHAPYKPPEKFMESVDFDTTRLPREPEYYSRLRHFSDATAFSQEECAYLRLLYLAEVASVDERVGFILKALEHRDLLRNTIIVFTSDHGEFFGEHDRLHHGRSFFEPVVHVPLICSGPRIPQGERISEPVSLVKLTPLILDLLMQMSGQSSEAQPFHRILSRHTGPAAPIYMDRIANRFLDRYIDYDALISDGYKLVTSLRDGRPVFELYDLTKDVGEHNDIAASAPGKVRMMYKTLLALRRECDLRLEENLVTLDSDAEVNQAARKTREQLRALGYIR